MRSNLNLPFPAPSGQWALLPHLDGCWSLWSSFLLLCLPVLGLTLVVCGFPHPSPTLERLPAWGHTTTPLLMTMPGEAEGLLVSGVSFLPLEFSANTLTFCPSLTPSSPLFSPPHPVFHLQCLALLLTGHVTLSRSVAVSELHFSPLG